MSLAANRVRALARDNRASILLAAAAARTAAEMLARGDAISAVAAQTSSERR